MIFLKDGSDIVEMIRKGLFLGCLIVLSFFYYIQTTSASVVLVEDLVIDDYKLFEDDIGDCNTYFGDPSKSQYPAYWMQWVLNVIKYVAIAALLVLSTVDFIKALVSNDKDALKKAGMTAAKRFIFVVILFFLPIIVDFIMRLFGAYGTCGIG